MFQYNNNDRMVSGVIEGNLQQQFNPLYTDYKTKMLEGFFEDTGKSSDKINLNDIYREIYLMCTVSGPTVDMICNLPWSEYALTGVKDKKILEIYESTLDELELIGLMTELSVSFLVLGEVIGSLIFNDSKGIFTDVICQNPDNCEITEIPLRGYDPKIDLKVPPDLKKFLNSSDPRDREARKEIPPKLLSKLMSGSKIPLEPLSTLYIARSYVPGVRTVSYFHRIVPLWLIEKALMRGTIIGAWRRQRSILHVTAGNEDWKPTASQISELGQLFNNADNSPQGAVVVTRPDIQTSELRCIVGSTLIHTEKGLKRIDSLINHDPYKLKNNTKYKLKCKIKGLYGDYENTKFWHYRGKKETIKVVSESGSNITCTKDHKILSLSYGGNFGLKPAESLLGSYICLDTKGSFKNKKVKLNLTAPNIEDRPSNKITIKPKYMTNDLAYILGFVCSDGQVLYNTVTVSSTDINQLKHYKKCIKSVFNIDCNISEESNWEGPFNTVINGDKCTRNKKLYWININNKKVVSYMEQLGLVSSETKPGPKQTSYYKKIPKSILEADKESRYSFIAAYVDGDGSVISKRKSKVEISIGSCSDLILNGFKCLLSDMGYLTNISYRCIHVYDSNRLYNNIYSYLKCNNKKPFNKCIKHTHYKLGIPSEAFLPMLEERFLRKKRKGSLFINDDGKEVLVFNYGTVFRHYKHSKSYFLYDKYDSGNYKKELAIIKQVSLKLYKLLMLLFKTRYKFEKITSLHLGSVEHVYDITMQGKPVFLANGIFIKNSGSDFWKVTDEADIFASAKMRSLGINESFLSGDSNYNTMEVSLSVFMENLRTFRSNMTRDVLTDKIFLNLAKVHGFKKRTTAELTHRLRFNAAKNMAEINDYIIPKVQWAKDLRAKYDQSYIDILNSVEEKGIPIPLVLYANAAGLSRDEILDSMSEDIEFRNEIKKFNDLLKSKGLEKEEEGDMFSSFKTKNKKLRRLKKLGKIPVELTLTDSQFNGILEQG